MQVDLFRSGFIVFLLQFVIFWFWNKFTEFWSELMFASICFWVCLFQYSHCWFVSSALKYSFIFHLIVCWVFDESFWTFSFSSPFGGLVNQNVDGRGRKIIFERTLPSLLVVISYSIESNVLDAQNIKTVMYTLKWKDPKMVPSGTTWHNVNASDSMSLKIVFWIRTQKNLNDIEPGALMLSQGVPEETIFSFSSFQGIRRKLFQRGSKIVF